MSDRLAPIGAPMVLPLPAPPLVPRVRSQELFADAPPAAPEPVDLSAAGERVAALMGDAAAGAAVAAAPPDDAGDAPGQELPAPGRALGFDAPGAEPDAAPGGDVGFPFGGEDPARAALPSGAEPDAAPGDVPADGQAEADPFAERVGAVRAAEERATEAAIAARVLDGALGDAVRAAAEAAERALEARVAELAAQVPDAEAARVEAALARAREEARAEEIAGLVVEARAARAEQAAPARLADLLEDARALRPAEPAADGTVPAAEALPVSPPAPAAGAPDLGRAGERAGGTADDARDDSGTTVPAAGEAPADVGRPSPTADAGTVQRNALLLGAGAPAPVFAPPARDVEPGENGGPSAPVTAIRPAGSGNGESGRQAGEAPFRDAPGPPPTREHASDAVPGAAATGRVVDLEL